MSYRARGYIMMRDGRRLTDDLDIAVEERHAGWGGSMYIPVTLMSLEIGGSYEVRLIDGRQGGIVITQMPYAHDQRTIRCVFEGSGPPPTTSKSMA